MKRRERMRKQKMEKKGYGLQSKCLIIDEFPITTESYGEGKLAIIITDPTGTQVQKSYEATIPSPVRPPEQVKAINDWYRKMRARNES
jgi:hypothetical protein